MTGLEPLLIAGLVAGAVGTGVKMIGLSKEAEAEAQANEYNAFIAERNIGFAEDNRDAALDQARVAAEDQRRDDSRVRGAMRAGYGASGFELTGSPLDVLADAASEQELDAQRIEYEGDVRARESAMEILGLRDEAKLSRMGAKNARTAGKYKVAGAALSGASSALNRMG